VSPLFSCHLYNPLVLCLFKQRPPSDCVFCGGTELKSLLWCPSPMMASLTVESTGRMFFSTSSIGPGLWAIFSFRLSASRALFSLIWVACNEGSAPVSGSVTDREHCISYYIKILKLLLNLVAMFLLAWPNTAEHTYSRRKVCVTV